MFHSDSSTSSDRVAELDSLGKFRVNCEVEKLKESLNSGE